MKKHYAQIDSLKGIAIFLVVLGHSIIVSPINLHRIKEFNYLFLWLSSVHLALFYTVSGFCFSYRNDYKVYITKKVKRILIPFIMFSALGITCKQVLPSIVNRNHSLSYEIKSTLLYGGEYVFLYTIFIIFLIYPIVYKFIKGSIIKSAIWLVLLIALRCIDFKFSYFSIGNVAYNLIFFSTGAVIKDFASDKIFEIDFGKVLNFVLTVVALSTWIFLLWIDKNYLLSKTYIPLLLVTFSGIITFYMCTKFELFNNFFARFGKYSLQIYLLNGYLLVLSRTIIISVFGMRNSVIIVLFNVLVDFFLSYIFIKYVVEKIKLLRHFMGMV